MYSTSQEYVDALSLEIDRAIENNRKSIYKINEKVSPETIGLVRNTFLKDSRIVLELKQCMSCNNVWDIIIIIKR